MAGHPTDIIFLTCDAVGVLPPGSALTPGQSMYHFMSDYTAKVARTEVGIKEPSATFSTCFGGPLLVWHPSKYAELLAAKIKTLGTRVWLVNTGWSGGAYGTGKRISLAFTRAIIDAIHSGALASAKTQHDTIFGLATVAECPGVPSEILIPRNAWTDKLVYQATASKLADLFSHNFKSYESGASADVQAAAGSGILASEPRSIRTKP
jgi:phosphoenolpyruvate carboxykinase (ATP)